MNCASKSFVLSSSSSPLIGVACPFSSPDDRFRNPKTREDFVKRVPTATARARVRRYEDAAALREALRRFDRHSEDIARTNGLTMRGYLLLLMVKTSRGLSEA